MTFEYQTWGLAENTVGNEAIAIKPLSAKLIQQTLNMINNMTDIKNFEITDAGHIGHYQGKNIHPKKLAWIRLERRDGKNSALRGEHISATIDINTLQIIGFTRMEKHLSGEIFTNHQTALNQAVKFLKTYAIDLMPEDTKTPELDSKISDLNPDSKIEFNPALNIGKIQLHWINQHTEEIICDKEKIEIHGIKVKMYIPSTKLWAWVIVDKTGNILTFERDIFWNFDLFKRETQMWLHDKWIEAHNITLTHIETETQI